MRQPLQQLGIVAAALAGVHAAHQRRERALQVVHAAAQFTRHRQGQQRHHPVGLDFIQPLQQPSALHFAEAVVDDQEARKAVGRDGPVAEHLTAAQNVAARQDGAVDPLPHVVAGMGCDLARDQFHSQRHQAFAGEAVEPVGRDMGGGQVGEVVRVTTPRHEREGGELGVPLPLQLLVIAPTP